MAKSIVIIGGGPGGEAAAKRAAARGARVTLVEKNRLGGVCLNWGCVPSKALLEAGRLSHAVSAAGATTSGGAGVRVRWTDLQKKKDELVSALRASLTQNYQRLGVRVVEGAASFADPATVAVKTTEGTERLPFDAAVVATGSAPFFPPPFDALAGTFLDSDRALSLDRVPASIAVVGGGAVGCEFACLFRELGAAVTIIEKTEGLLPGEDPAVVRVLQTAFASRGIDVRTGTTVRSAQRSGVGWVLTLEDGGTVSVEELLVCVGRKPSVAGLGLEAAGVRVERDRPVVDAFLKTSHPAVYAVGDLNGLSLLAHAAAAQAEIAVDHAFGESRPYRNERVPRCLYTWPEVARVGDWTHTAQARGVETKAQRFFFKGSPKALAANEGEGFLQIVSEKAGGRILGAQIVGPHATEIIHVFAVALAAEMTVPRLRDVIYAHPTLSEGIREALSR